MNGAMCNQAPQRIAVLPSVRVHCQPPTTCFEKFFTKSAIDHGLQDRDDLDSSLAASRFGWLDGWFTGARVIVTVGVNCPWSDTFLGISVDSRPGVWYYLAS